MTQPTEDPLSPMRPVCVLGMHRSGTSCLTGSVERASVHFGDVITEAPYNKKGNRENRAIMLLNDEVLSTSGGSWHMPPVEIRWIGEQVERRDAILEVYESQGERWGFKDPRVLITLPFWEDSGTAFQFIGTFRHPLAVSRSLRSRDRKLTVEKTLSLWCTYNQALLGTLAREPFPLVNFDLDPDAYLAQLEKAFAQIGLPSDTLQMDDRFFDQTLRHQSADEVPGEAMTDECANVYEQLMRYWRENY